VTTNLRRLSVVVLATAVSAAASTRFDNVEAFGSQDPPVSKRLKLTVPGKVVDVIWSIQRELCAIQIDFPPVRQGEKEPTHARTQIWLLGSGGSIVLPTSKSPESPAIGFSNLGETTYFVSYTFPLSAKGEAIAVVLQVDDEFFVEPLPVDPIIRLTGACSRRREYHLLRALRNERAAAEARRWADSTDEMIAIGE
jgi:hypothetical protein